MNKKAFTLVEIVIGVSISMIIMLGVAGLMLNAVKNITIQQNILTNQININDISKLLGEVFVDDLEFVDEYSTGNYKTGIILKKENSYGRGDFLYLGAKSFTGYCDSDSDYDSDYIFYNLALSYFYPYNDLDIDQVNHLVYSGSQVFSGKGVFGNNFVEGIDKGMLYLNTPTSKVYIDGKKVLSDTGNDRILYFSGANAYTLLDRNDGIKTPIGLLYNDNYLYIANAGKNEVLRYFSKDITQPNLNLDFTPDNNFSGSKIDIEFFREDTDVNISGTYNTGSFTFSSNISENEDFATGNTNKISYYFANYTGIEEEQSECTGTEYRLVGDNPVKCVFSGTGVLSTEINQIFNSGSTYSIEISGINGDFSNTGSYYVKLSIGDYEKYFPYFTKGDGDIFTKGDNTLEVFARGISYPSEITLSGINIVINDYFKGFSYNYNTGGTLYSTGNLTLDIDNYPKREYLSDFLIEDIEIENEDDLLSIKIDYYKNFSCYNQVDNIKRQMIFKKSLK